MQIRLKNTAGVLALLLFCSLCYGQQTINLKTGFNGITNAWPYIELAENDSVIELSYQEAFNSKLRSSVLFQLNSRDLSFQDTIRISIPDPNIEGGGYFVLFDQNDQNQFYVDYVVSGDTTKYEFLHTNQRFEQLGRRFSLELVNEQFQSLLLFDEVILALSANANGDTVYLSKLDTANGQVLQREFYTQDSLNNEIPTQRLGYLHRHPNKASSFLISSNAIGNGALYEMNYNTLDTVQTFTISLTQSFLWNIGTKITTALTLNEDWFAYSGYVAYIFPDLTDILRPYVFKRSWNGDSLEYHIAGNNTVDDVRSYEYHHSAHHNTDYLAGSFPFNDFMIHSNEIREVVIYRWNKWGQDSLVLFGSKNHVASSVTASKSGDLYVAGTYNDYPDSDSNYVFLTKIPQYAIGMVEREEIAPRFRIYPNPVARTLKLEMEEDFHGLRGKQYKIVNQAGQEMRRGTLQDREIDLEALPKGVYILMIGDQSRSDNGIFIKR